jgi:hypothetical protein
VDGTQIQPDALCGSPDLAASVVLRFTATTNLLRSLLQREKLTPDPPTSAACWWLENLTPAVHTHWEAGRWENSSWNLCFSESSLENSGQHGAAERQDCPPHR